jgi:PD-(D/E)XK nuclease superfamily
MSNTQGKSNISSADRKALEALLIDNQDLIRLEGLLDQFNIFEALGVVRQELRHSDFLAFLLDPRQNHSLEDIFVKQLLQKALLAAEDIDIPITPLDLDIWDLRQAYVQREWLNIDILLLDDKYKLALIIENKIGSKEHSKQLQRYYKDIQRHYPNYSIVGLYLTPEGDQPTENTYISVSYNLICTILEDLVKSRGSTLKTEVLIVINHYTSMLRRHIVSDSEIADLCRSIYFKHQRALDLIYEHRPDRQTTIQKELENLIQQQNNFQLVSSSKTDICFILRHQDISLSSEEKDR